MYRMLPCLSTVSLLSSHSKLPTDSQLPLPVTRELVDEEKDELSRLIPISSVWSVIPLMVTTMITTTAIDAYHCRAISSFYYVSACYYKPSSK